MSVAAIILAAGASRRLGQPKQLVGFDGEPLLERALRMRERGRRISRARGARRKLRTHLCVGHL